MISQSFTRRILPLLRSTQQQQNRAKDRAYRVDGLPPAKFSDFGSERFVIYFLVWMVRDGLSGLR